MKHWKFLKSVKDEQAKGYCPICGRSMKTVHCTPAQLRAIDAANVRAEREDHWEADQRDPFYRTEAVRLIEGLRWLNDD